MPQPVHALLRHSMLLQAAIEDCLREPAPRPVHKLRSSTRRIDAMLELLALSADLPHLKQEIKPYRRHLSRLRRAAGKVRDLDVHRTLLERYRKNRATAEHAARLDRSLASARDKAAKKLQRRLEEENRKLQQAFDRLQAALTPALDFEISAAELVRRSRHWLSLAIQGLDPSHDDDLHDIRKACKTARYLVEIAAEGSKAAHASARAFEKIQQSTGDWHDHQVLTEEARSTLPKNSVLITNLRQETARLRHKAQSLAKQRLASL